MREGGRVCAGGVARRRRWCRMGDCERCVSVCVPRAARRHAALAHGPCCHVVRPQYTELVQRQEYLDATVAEKYSEYF